MDDHSLSPSMLVYTDTSDFVDYGAFLDVQLHDPPAITYGLSDSSGKTTPPDGSSSAGTEMIARGPSQKQRLERRGHTKSRRGCYNCKRRRIKCQETRPACGHCVKTGLKCEYPALPQITHQPHHQIPLFSLQDMRVFQHFLTQCYPHHPLKQEEIWTHEIPCLAHNHDFLMHAILGFAASELIPSDPSLVTAAMSHRVKAIRAIKKRLTEHSNRSTNFEEANAMIATCFALTFQSVTLDDGLAEYMTFIRGIVIVGMQMMFKGLRPVFTNLMGTEQEALLAPLMEGLPLIQRGWVDAARDSLINLRPLCLHPVEIQYQEQLMGIVEKLYESSFEAWRANSRQYTWWMLLPHSMFQELLDMNNQVMILLHAHWIAGSQIMAFITEQEHSVREKEPAQQSNQGTIDPGFLRWLKYLNSRVDYEHQVYNQWPMWVDEQLDRDITFFGKRR
ncbi:hypothetical protein S40285_03373 [Stachybotrys chlorohalonatus IBT 40285]|uniref:Zn(2)-C6 fungal-type domain-containing protein n=1 Tax=Stachybotrys chlorohalonatus (strain IBT 40285) TaxID=1283841 RepID=A0A084QQD0_STAC4|nr:hypothetical protein S40285_03373 [Stachybotrys chlorohalonata IBT 40285]